MNRCQKNKNKQKIIPSLDKKNKFIYLAKKQVKRILKHADIQNKKTIQRKMSP